MLFIAQLEVLLWYCINCESSIFIMLLITTSKNVCVEVYEYRACFGKTRPCFLDDSRRFLTCIWLLDTEIIIFFVHLIRSTTRNKKKFIFLCYIKMEDLLKLDYFNLVHEKLEGKFTKIFLPIKNRLILFVCLFVLGGGRRGDFLFTPKYSLPRGRS